LELEWLLQSVLFVVIPASNWCVLKISLSGGLEQNSAKSCSVEAQQQHPFATNGFFFKAFVQVPPGTI
jgi:hypothetical protein